jgi:hypothetical protein
LGDPDCAREDEEELPADPAFPGQDLPLAHPDALGEPHHMLQLLRGAAGELVDHLQPSTAVRTGERIWSGQYARGSWQRRCSVVTAFPWEGKPRQSGHPTAQLRV